ncbi:inter-alpha-trypsin inhibitor heavy chain H4-like [Ptychodera flava]|uniref:inter-alpha-trypsin inhibitor heavy chain H4-like n=1 Tax=Ptychodera flava TaxID=63121 RepID=UPI00396A24F0
MNSLLLIVLFHFPIALAYARGRNGETGPDKVVTRKFHVTSRITSRFASTEVKSLVENKASTSQEVVFDMKIPETAFTSSFTVKIGNKTYTGQVQEKEEARRTYSRARERGQTAGHVSVRQRVRETETFQVSMNVEAGAKAHFVLTYQEILFRRRGIYEHRISIRPNQAIGDMKVKVLINEPLGIAFIQVPPIQSTAMDRWVNRDVDNPLATIERRSPEQARIVFRPSREEQIDVSASGIMGDFVVRYDVHHKFDVGDLQVRGSYFVHHFAPVGLKSARKNVVFLIDVSGSMAGQKLRQTKSALEQILGDMGNNDKFTIVTFNDNVNRWQVQLVPASDEFRQMATNFVHSLHTGRATNINSALLVAVDILDTHHDNDVSHLEKEASMVIMLTDGRPTSGVQNFERIQENIKTAVNGRYSIFCLGFGGDVDYDALEILSLQNNGVARRIFEDADASLQLKGFYDEVANPVLFNLDIDYPGNTVDQNSITKSNFPVVYDGSEIVVAGKLKDVSKDKLKTQVTASSFNDSIKLVEQVSLNQESGEDVDTKLDKETVIDVTHRFWLYLTTKQILDQMKLTNSENLREQLRQKVVDLSIENNFVTKVTSLVVTDDDEYQSSEPSILPSLYLADSPLALQPMRARLDLAYGLVSKSVRSFKARSGRTKDLGARRRRLRGRGKKRPRDKPGKNHGVPATTQRPVTNLLKDPFYPLRDVYFGAFAGRCEVGMNLQSLDQIICFRVPEDFIGVSYTLFESKAGVIIMGSFERLGTGSGSTAKCLKSRVVINSIPNDIAVNRTTLLRGSEQCDAIHISLSEKYQRSVEGLLGRLVSQIPSLGMKSYKSEEIDGVEVFFLSSGDGNFEKSLFQPL